ncbi:(4S)-4-hydroxy-5-phosphonooxypentane-2,3-dione isomerase [Escherichia coli]|nr:(4S)-4-hydroxy-5-phosphonooxypentane-2,3-dione isomerase [Escherichia coli]
MHVTLVEINVHEDKVSEFIEVFRLNHLGSVGEEGNLRFDVLQDPEIKSRFYIYEAYKDEAAVAFHKTTPHYLACVEKLESLMSCPRKKANIQWTNAIRGPENEQFFFRVKPD